MVKPPENLDSFDSFVKIVEALRGPDGCPWDKEQTHRTLAPYAIEESFELAEAIETGDVSEMVGELGDVLLQVVLHAEIGRQAGTFTLEDVVRGISSKMVRRHPHVFGDVAVAGSADVLQNWAKVKAAEKAARGLRPSFAFDLPRALPALQRAQKIGDKSAKVAFDWPSAFGVFDKVLEEVEELRAEVARLPGAVGSVGADGGAAGVAIDGAAAASAVGGASAAPSMSEELRHALEHEIGDVLFSTAQLARHVGLEAEQCLRTANTRFESRYVKMRENVEASGRDWSALPDADKEAAWQQAKRDLK